ncbi:MULTISPECIES: EAL domain-containing protein [unclassified Massilia]|uniref:bifunctional diguanylate cyclase/phosphodiesterase n=1 Tax=unclassified Massilia TaxID=2609279 RepID=UPI001B82033D|nr:MULTISPECIES: EAL domain-containing protein [unclassified Massilia]MBQ5940710.1 EAL domain-containing protein [Massilia sp. AB1]MBQ5963718.1 EAL domain-containing protein [Massilia sp. ZL223]
MHTPDHPARSRTRPYPMARLVIIASGLIAALGMVTASMLYASYEDTLRDQKTNLRNIAIIFAAQTTGVAQAVDSALQRAASAVRRGDPAALAPLLAEESAGPAHAYLLRIAAFDASGKLLASSRADHSAARALPALSAPPPGGPSPQIAIHAVDRMSGRGVINFTRHVFDNASRHIGTVVAQVDSAHFERIYRLIDLGPGGSVTLFHRDGTMLIRGPSFPEGIGRSFLDTPLFKSYLPQAPRGSIETLSPLDGIPRLYGYDTVEGFPLVIITGLNREAALESWYGRLWTALAFYLLLSAVLSVLAWRVGSDTRRQFRLIELLSASESRLARRFDYLASLINAVGAPIWVLDSARRIVLANEAFGRLVGRRPEDLMEMEERAVLGEDAQRERRYQAVLEQGSSAESISTMRDGGGEARTVIELTARLTGEGGDAQLVTVLTDITERERAEARLAYLAEFDVLTGLPNQSQFWRLLETRLPAAATGERSLAAMVLVFQRLHEIVDLLGRDAGDRALRRIGDQLRAACGEAGAVAGIVARIRGAEFAFLLDAAASRGAVERFAMQVHDLLSAPFSLDGRDFYLEPVLGVAMFPQDGHSADELYRAAQNACSGHGVEVGEAVHFFSASMHSSLDQRLTVEAHLRRALERRELRLVFQPKVTIDGERIVGFEALMRWNSAELGEVSPAQFIPIAERTGLIIPIGAWALEETCRRMRDWATQLGRPVKVAVNLSPRQLYQKTLLDTIRRCIAEYGVGGGCLELEITETALMSREEEVDVLMHEIRALGVELSIDDFGTGYSSLAYLKRFPVARLKVDRAFVRDLDRDGDSAAIALSIVNLARGLKLKVVAEGVETAGQLAILRGMACDEYQGFLFSPPVERDAVPELVRRYC